jgi:hypothetical protein
MRVSWRWLWRMMSSGTLHRVTLVRTDVSEELSPSFIRVTRVGELGTNLAVTSNRRTLRFLTRATRHNIPKDIIPHSPSLHKKFPIFYETWKFSDKLIIFVTIRPTTEYPRCELRRLESLVTLKMEATCSSETSVLFTRATRRHIPWDEILIVSATKISQKTAFSDPT